MRAISHLMPPHLRRALLGLYLVLSTSWVTWFGYQIYSSTRQYDSARELLETGDNDSIEGRRSEYDREQLWKSTFEQAQRRTFATNALLVIPIGAPLLYLIAAWVVIGSPQPNPKPDVAGSETDCKTTVDYYPTIAGAVSRLRDNTPKARHVLYARARTVLIDQLRRQNVGALQIASEERMLEAAIRQVEEKNGSTAQLRALSRLLTAEGRTHKP